ncbi:MAG TPA: Ig-like domain-containing protein, partial [Longimicrobium sp.]|nr:Ig-like domain-containing protein [Longimicrobium sp.]
MSLRRRALFLAGLFVAVSCSDAGNPLEPGPTPRPEPKDVLQALDCSVSVRGDNFSCAPTKPSTGGALGSGFTFVGGQDKYVHLEKVAAQNIAPDTPQIDVTIKNLIPQALGTTDGETEDPYGVRVFFMEDPVTNPGGLMASVGNEDGTDFFTTVNQSYFEYDTIIKPDSVTEPRSWKLKYDPSVGPTGTIFFRVLLRAQVKYEAGWVDVTPDEDTIAPGATVQLTAITRNKLGDTTGVSQNVSWSSSDTAIATVDANGLVTGDSAGVVYIKATPPGVQAPDSARIVVNSAVQAVTDSVDAFGNVTITYPASIGLLANDTDADGPSQTLSVLPDTVPTAEGGTARISANGSFTYLSFPGFTGKDTIPYAVTDGVVTDSGVAIVNVGQRYWYVQPGAAGSGDGTDAAPFNTLAAADAASAGTEPILVRGGGGVPAAGGGIVLNTGQPLLGQGIAADLTATLMGGVVSVTLLDGTGVSPVIRASSGATVTLGQNNTVRGVNIEAASGAAITGSNFGTLTADEMLLLNPTGGPALNLSNGTLNNVTVLSLSSTGSSTTGLSLTNVGGTLAVNGGTIAGSAGTAMNVAGDSAVVINYAGNIQQSSSGMALLSVSGNHTGTLTFNVGALTASGGTGLQFSGAKGTYNFNGTTTLAGGDAGIDIVGSSDGTFAFSADARIENPTGTAFRVNGSSPDVTYNGTILRTANAALLVDLTSVGAGSAITFSPAAGTDSLHASVGGGIQLSAAVGTVGFSGTTTLTGAAPGVDLLAGSNGTVSFGALTSIIGNGLLVSDSEPVLTYAGTISTTTGRPVEVNGASPCGTVTVSGSITSNGGGSGILVQDCSAGTISLTGAKTLATGANPGVTLSNNNSAAAINLTGGALSITTSAAAGILGNGAAGFGTLTVSNATVSATGGPALDLTNGTLTGTFTSLSSTNSTGTGVTLSSVNGTLNASAGSISGAAGTAFNVSGGNLAGTLAVGITQNNNAPTLVVAGGHNTGTLTFSGDVSAGNGNGVQFTDADGTYTFTGDFTLNGAGDEGIDIAAASTGTVNVTPSGGNAAAITSPSGIAIAITGGSADLNYSGNVTQASNQPLLSVSGVHTGDVTFPSGTLNASNGNGLQFDNADGTYDFDGTVMLSGGDAGIDITNNSTGTFTFPATATITSPSTGNLVSILNSAPNFTYLGAFTKANNNVTGILVQSNTGGTINFTGSGVTKNIQSGNAAGVSLVNNTGTAINFGGGSLVIQSGSGAGFNATGGGTINVTGAGNTISSGTGTALNVQNTTIGASGLSFVSISANGGTHGINLSNTGNTNGLQVTGTGS